MGQMSNRSSNRRELRLLGSFRNFAQEVVGSFRKALASALRLPSSVYEISGIDESPRLTSLFEKPPGSVIGRRNRLPTTTRQAVTERWDRRFRPSSKGGDSDAQCVVTTSPKQTTRGREGAAPWVQP
jgi:hypothetical protein